MRTPFARISWSGDESSRPQAAARVMGAEGAAEIVYGKEINESDNPEATKASKIEEYRRKFSNPYNASESLHVDAVVDPKWTRHYLKMGLRTLRQKDCMSIPKKHGNIPV